MLAALADGESRIAGAGDGADVRSTAGIVGALGADGRARPASDGRTVDYRVVSPGADGAARARATRSTAATPGRACGCSPGCSPGCR